MRTSIFTASSVIAVSCCVLTSCDTPVGQGAAWGAATGAIIGGAATGNVRAASIGAAAGAAAGRPRPVIRMRAGRGDRAFTTALTPDGFMICAARHLGALLATLIRAGFFADHN